MADVQQSVLDLVADHVAAKAIACPESDLIDVLQHVYREDELHAALEKLTATPAKLEMLPANAGPEYTPTLDGWLASKHNVSVQHVIGVAIRLLRGIERQTQPGGTFEWSQLAAAGKFTSRDYPLARFVLIAASLCDGVASEIVWKEGQSPQATFRLPQDRPEIAQCADVAAFVEYRRKTPLLLVYLKKRWARELTPDRRFVLRETYDYFSRHGDWPKSREIEAKLLTAGRRGLSDIGRDTYLFRSGNALDEREHVKLTLTGLLHCTGSEDDQRLVVQLLAAAGKLARERPSDRTISLVALGERAGVFEDDEASLLAFTKLVDSEPDAYFSQSGPAVTDYVVSLSPRLIKFAGANRLEDILVETYKDEMRSAVAFLNGETGATDATDEQPRAQDRPSQLRLPLSVNRTPAMAAMSRLDQEMEPEADAAHAWSVEILVGNTVYLGMWAPDRQLLELLGRDAQESDVTFGIVSVIRRRVRRSLQSVQGDNLIGISDARLFQPLKTLDPRTLIERDVERTLFEIAWSNLRGRLETIERTGGSIHELRLDPASEWTKNEPLLRRDPAYKALKEFYDAYAQLLRNRSFMPDRAREVSDLIARLETLGIEALNELWEVAAPSTNAFWQLLLRTAPSTPDGEALVWNARITDLEVFANIDGLNLTQTQIVELLTGQSIPNEFPWTPKVAGNSVSFTPRNVIQGKTRPQGAGVVIEALEINSLRNVAAARIVFDTPEHDRDARQCLTVLGENGSGKTTLLQALALALLDGETASSVLSRFATDAPLIRDGYEHGRAVVTMGGRKREIEILKREAIEYVASRPREALANLPVYGYGAHRSIGAKSSELALGAVDAVATLFDPRAALISGEVWLLQIQNAALRNRGLDELFFEGVRELLKRLLPGVESIEVNQNVVIRGAEMGTAPLAGLSGGFLTMTSWIIDLVARAAVIARREGQAVDSDFSSKMRGVLLIDEIDLHLHPRWQQSVVQDVRKAFPNMTIIVTTHSPMVVLGAIPGDVYVIDRKSGSMQLISMRVPLGADADRILTDWFGLPSVTDPDTTELLAEYNQLLARRDGASADRLKELERVLRNRFGTFAVTPIERAALEVAARIMAEQAEKFENLPLAERKELGARIAAAVEARARQERDQ